MSNGPLLMMMGGAAVSTVIDKYLAISHSGSPFFTVYDYDDELTPVKLNDPSTLPPGTCNSVSWQNGSNVFAVGTNASPFVMFYEIISGVITKLSDPATLPTNTVNTVRFSDDGRYLCVGIQAAASLQTLFFYDMSSGSPVLVSGTPAFLLTITNCSWDPAVQRCMLNNLIFDLTSGTAVLTFTLLTNTYFGSGWSKDSRYLCAMDSITPFIHFWDWDTGSPVLLSDPATIPATVGRDAAWDIDDDRIVTTVHGDTGGGSDRSTRYDLTTGVPVTIADLSPEPHTSGAGSPMEISYRNDNSLIGIASSNLVNTWVYDNTVTPPVSIVKPPLSGTGAFGVTWGGS